MVIANVAELREVFLASSFSLVMHVYTILKNAYETLLLF